MSKVNQLIKYAGTHRRRRSAHGLPHSEGAEIDSAFLRITCADPGDMPFHPWGHPDTYPMLSQGIPSASPVCNVCLKGVQSRNKGLSLRCIKGASRGTPNGVPDAKTCAGQPVPQNLPTSQLHSHSSLRLQINVFGIPEASTIIPQPSPGVGKQMNGR